MLDSGEIKLEVSVPCIGATFPSDRNFYSRQDGQLDFSSAGEQMLRDSEDLENRVADMESKGVEDPELNEIKNKITRARELANENPDIERTQEAQEKLLEVKKILAQVRKNHLTEIRQMELDSCVNTFNEFVRKYAKKSEADSFDALHRTAEHNIVRKSRDFEETLDEMHRYNFAILWRQDWFVMDFFRNEAKSPQSYSDQHQFAALVQQGETCIKNDDIAQLRETVAAMQRIRIYRSRIDEVMAEANIIRG